MLTSYTLTFTLDTWPIPTALEDVMTVGTKVMTTEHPNSIGEVIRVNDAGDLTIQFTTAPRENLPFGHVCTEFWPVSDHHLLVEIEA